MPDEAVVAQASPTRLELKAALLIALLVLLLFGVVLYVMHARGVFEPTQTLVLLADDSEGVTTGSHLSYAGFPIGRVRRIELTADGPARIVIDVPAKDAHWLRTSSVFTLTRGLVGDTSLRAYTGVPDDPPLPPDAVRRALIGDATAEIPRLVAEGRELLKNLTALTARDSSLAATLDNLRDASARLNGPHGALGFALGNDADAKKIVVAIERASALLARADALVAQAGAQVFGPGGVMPEVKASVVELRGALLAARESMQQLDKLLIDAQAVAANARAATIDLPALRAEVELSLRKLNRMIDELSRRWPFANGKQELKLP